MTDSLVEILPAVVEWTQYEVDGDDYIPIERWGRDHWSALMYLETRATDAGGVIDNRRMRCNARLHREFANVRAPGYPIVDGKQYPTRLRDGEIENHDDWSCLEDLISAGLIEGWYRVKYPAEAFGNSIARIELTELGWWVAAQLRRHKAEGHVFADFCPELP